VAKSELQRRLEAFGEACRRRGLRVTHQRTEIFREAAATDEHPDAETLYQRVRKRLPSVSRDTVYRTLATLEDLGLVRKTQTLSSTIRYDANTGQHHHFVCSRCGRVQDFSSEALSRLPLPRSVAALGRVTSAHVQVLGVCSDCRRRRGQRRRR
jgi:Fur family peroxide stress response transcriptional regulator